MRLDPLAAALRDTGGLLAGAVADPPYPPADHGERVPADYSLIVEAIREGYSCTTAARASWHPTTPTWRCWPATACTRSGSRGWPSWATSGRCGSSPT